MSYRIAPISLKVEGLPVILGRLSQVKPAKMNQIVRKGLEKAARVIVKAVKANLKPGGRKPSGYDTGALRKSISFKVGTAKDGHTYAVVGPQRAVKRSHIYEGGRKIRTATLTKFGGRLKGKQKGKDPANYAHLIEYGHRIAAGGTLTRIQRPGWTPELVWSKRLKTLVFKHGAPKRTARSKVTGEVGKGKSIGQVFGIGFMVAAYRATKDQAAAIIKQHMEEAIRKLLVKGK